MEQRDGGEGRRKKRFIEMEEKGTRREARGAKEKGIEEGRGKGNEERDREWRRSPPSLLSAFAGCKVHRTCMYLCAYMQTHINKHAHRSIPQTA